MRTQNLKKLENYFFHSLNGFDMSLTSPSLKYRDTAVTTAKPRLEVKLSIQFDEEVVVNSKNKDCANKHSKSRRGIVLQQDGRLPPA